MTRTMMVTCVCEEASSLCALLPAHEKITYTLQKPVNLLCSLLSDHVYTILYYTYTQTTQSPYIDCSRLWTMAFYASSTVGLRRGPT